MESSTVTDISGRVDADTLRKASPYSYWLKPIDTDKTIALADYDLVDKFRQVAIVGVDDEMLTVTTPISINHTYLYFFIIS